MPTDRDLEKIEKMVEEIGEKERELGEINETYLEGREKEEVKEKDEFSELLEDIDLGLREEKELESKLSTESGEKKEEVMEEMIPEQGIREEEKE